MTSRLLTAVEVADMLAVTPGWVREHAAELGAFRLGDGPRPRLRFEQAKVREVLESRRLRAVEPEPVKARRRPGPEPKPKGVELVDFGWEAA